PAGVLLIGDDVPQGHKVAVRDVAEGAPVHKYGTAIGIAVCPIEAGRHVHSHNLAYADALDGSARDAARAAVPADPGRTFDGYPRADGRAGTRNMVGVLATVNCAAATARLIAAEARPFLAQYPHVDGVAAFTHTGGCGFIPDSPGGQVFLRTLRGYAAHPNLAGLIIVGLGCEMVPVQAILETAPIPADTLVDSLVIQELGGVRATVRAGVEKVRAMVAAADQRRRQPLPVAQLVLGLNCGGSDGYSGVTANPALGWASDRLVAGGGASVLAETSEITGAEDLLVRRAVSPAVCQALAGKMAWWREYVRRGGGSLDNNPSPGNKAGGLTTIIEKSLGAVAKSGQAPLQGVLDYAAPVPGPGLYFMDTPGYDPVSVTGLIAGGANVVVFTTGRGSVLGGVPTPVLKVATNTALFERLRDDMDLDAGPIAAGTATVEDVGRDIYEAVIAVASGRRTASEELGLGEAEFVPWAIGAVT
ncbi:MAG: altronate dehydratase family protein, partial [Propionibacteriaceae bacterium]|nr:altronate dehydratase family protein [Propionibacteriaceae bacterium]